MELLSPQEADNTDYGLMVGERVQKKDLLRELYLAYAMSVIVDRALPDVRDGMKPVQRRVIYAMYDGGYRPDRGYSKCARVVGEVMGTIRTAIPPSTGRCVWRSRGRCDTRSSTARATSAPPAMTRQPQCVTRNAVWRRSPWKWCVTSTRTPVDFLPNYDGKTQEPTVLPARFPEPAVQRLVRHRRRHGDQHSSATCARWQKACIGRSTIRTRAVRNCSRQPDPHHQGTGLPYRRHDSRP